MPLRDEAGHLYALTAVIKPDRILGVVRRQAAPSGSVIAVIDADGSIVARSKDHDKRVAGPAGPVLTQLMAGGLPEGVGRNVNYEGDTLTSAFTRLSRHGWTVAVGVPRPSIGPASLAGITMYGWGLAASLLACVGLAWLLSIRITRSFANLQRGAAALGAGEQVEVAPTRIRELDSMGQALEKAASQHAAHEQERSRLLASLEEALAASRDASRVKDEFLAVLGHELRNPLSPIVASLDLLDLRADAGNARERTIMRRQVNHLKRLVDDLLDVSRITSGKMQLDLRPLNLAELVRHTTGERPGVPVALSAPAEVWVNGDESRLVQVLNNLLSNAERFGAGKPIRVLLEVDGDQARLEVSDGGIGMPHELLASVFEPFYQAPQQVARSTGGLGLGLAIVRRIALLHGGQVSAHSEGPGKGSRFVVCLPLAPAQLPAPAAPAGQPGVRTSVLVVDDNIDAAATTALILQGLGHEVHVAHSGAEALAVFERSRPAVAILDIGLPDMDGHALAAAMRAHADVPAPRLVALTGYGQQADIDRARQAGFDLHLTKPATLDDLAGAVSDAGVETGQSDYTR
ncbi:ATP-binding protein [Massilia sp. Dwa41.01b]|uniref:ATP-binding protein n=1 Tax=Massilia sp. Dwa41.01b TaxID=2709302 RepID=UPI001E5AC497|nr:ATP-binding protein [Massilia sp. Dwa41.01b]